MTFYCKTGFNLSKILGHLDYAIFPSKNSLETLTITEKSANSAPTMDALAFLKDPETGKKSLIGNVLVHLT